MDYDTKTYITNEDDVDEPEEDEEEGLLMNEGDEPAETEDENL